LTVDEWITYLLDLLRGRLGELARLQQYYDGLHPLPQAPKKIEEKFQAFARMSRTNWMQLVVDAPAERLEVVGFNVAGQPALDVWHGIWQGNQLDADSKLVHLDALTLGSSYVLVWPDQSHPSGVRVTMEHPTQCIVAYEPGDRRRRAAGLKVWCGLDKRMHLTLWLPGEVHRFSSESEHTGGVMFPPATWVPRPGVERVTASGIDGVPLVEMRPRPRWDGTGRSELDGLTDLQDRINATTFNRLVAGEYGAFIQRWVTGIEIEEDENGQPIKPFNLGIDQILVAEDPGARFGAFTATDLGNYVKSVEADVAHLAAISKTPPHYLLGAIVNASGDALKAAETGLVSKVRDRQTFLGEDWEEVVRLALAATGDGRAKDMSTEVVWKDPETRSEGELVDGLVKMRSLDVPRSVLWQRWGASPQDVEAWKQAAADEALLVALAQPAPAAPASGVADGAV